MIERGTFRSLTLINWNGFFARTFDLDTLVTTLSGGNGAGKSTAMAAFVTALIPDLTLLHFRNTTEAGATTGSKDKGLYGKLKPGVCYVLIDVVNSHHQRVLLGVRLQQIAGRDKKVDIKPFIIQRIAVENQPIELLTDRAEGRQARVLSLPELKERIEGFETAQFKQFNSITEYHALMFDLGIIPKRLRSSADRSKFYRLIEASLYGGISSAITRSLRDYLLPENSGVKQAFQDMEIALRENRMTLAAIRMTQKDRDLFKHLISETTAYVAADYMRHTNERRGYLEKTLTLRNECLTSRLLLSKEQVQHAAMSQELAEQSMAQRDLEIDHQSASDHLNLVQTAVRQHEKVLRYQDELEELRAQLLEQEEQVLEATDKLEEYQEQTDAAEHEVDELKNQLANYQQALDVQQTRALQYQQACQALKRAQEICQQPDLVPEILDECMKDMQIKEQTATQKLLSLQQKKDLYAAAKQQFEQAYQLVCLLAGETARIDAWPVAQQLLRDWPTHRHQAERVSALRQRHSELSQRLQHRSTAEEELNAFYKRIGRVYTTEQLLDLQDTLQQQLGELSVSLADAGEKRLSLRQERDLLQQKITQLRVMVPQWLAAQEACEILIEQCGVSFTQSQQVTEQMQHLLEHERLLSTQRDQLTTQRAQLDEQIEQLSQPCGAEDHRLIELAERFNGVLLSEIYEDVVTEDAPYFSALYGPARQAIVVPDLSLVREQLTDIEDCPEDVYLIEGDAQAFDDSVFAVEELSGAVLVKIAQRQWRYSRFPKIALFGKASRDNRLNLLQTERTALVERYAEISFELQKTQRLHQALGNFIGKHLAIAFTPDPEEQIRQWGQQQIQLDRQQQKSEADYQQQLQQNVLLNSHLNTLNQLIPVIPLLDEIDLADKVAATQEELIQAEDSTRYLQQYQTQLEQLEQVATVLQTDPEEHQQLEKEYSRAQIQQQQCKQKLFALMDVLQRKTHFSYQDTVDLVTEHSELNDQLRQHLEKAEIIRTEARVHLKQQQAYHAECTQLAVALKSALTTKQDLQQELSQELQEIGVPADKEAEQRAKIRRDAIQATLNANRLRCSQLEKKITFCEAEMDMLQKKLSRLERDYRQMREHIVITKARWCTVIRLVKEHNIERRLHKRELAYMSADELRSMSDKSLGALRLAVADNEYLRDVLRASEDGKHPEKKIQFYIAVYQHLRERIRQDIMHTDDPVEAIEQMEVELARLLEELTTRERKLAISAKSVANIIRKTIQREQNRIRMLNYGLQSVAFGQVKSVRLNVNIRQSHGNLLNVLSAEQEQHQDLFNDPNSTFSEALAKLQQRLNPQIDFGQKSKQSLGEALLDYRNYLELEVEVNRGAEGWLKAESGALSTGEAIGTGMSILVMVVQSWEEESRRLRAKDSVPCRLLFLDEAARLDAKSIATLFELCERLAMQLIIAAPENISPEKGTTYKLVRKVFNNVEHVHVVGLRGFAVETVS